MMNDERLAEIAARAEAATPGPWELYSDEWRWIRAPGKNQGITICGNYDWEDGGVASTKEDAEFIAHARTDIPALIAEVTRLRKERDKWITEFSRLDERDCERRAKLAAIRKAAEVVGDLIMGTSVSCGGLRVAQKEMEVIEELSKEAP